MGVYFIGDTHFGHENIIRLNNRPFANIEEMDNTLIENWNSIINDLDEVYILGDVWFKGKRNSVEYVKKLNGVKHLIKGNHDVKPLKNQSFVNLFESVNDILDIVVDNQRLILCHYPMLEWNGYYRESLHIHGHIHNNRKGVFEYLKTEPRALNAGVDLTGFRPVTLKELKVINEKWKNINI